MATQRTAQQKGGRSGQPADGAQPQRELPDKKTALELLDKMLLIRHFEERAQEMYMKAKIGGFLHLAIGEEATIVGTRRRACATQDYLISTYREHGQALARGTDPKVVMAELFGREGGTSRGRGGSMHLFDPERRFMGGYGIVGGNLPLAAGRRARVRLQGRGLRDRLHVRRRRLEPGHVRRDDEHRRAVEAAGRVPGGQQPVRDGHRALAPLRRHRPLEEGGVPRRARASASTAWTCSRCASASPSTCAWRARIASRRWSRRSPTASAATPPPTRRSTAPRRRSQQWRERDPILLYAKRARRRRACSTRRSFEERDRRAIEIVDEAVEFADASPEPALESLYDNVYVLGDQVQGWYSVDERTPEVHRGEDEREVGKHGVAHELAEAGAAYAGAGDVQKRRRARGGRGREPAADAAQEDGD